MSDEIPVTITLYTTAKGERTPEALDTLNDRIVEQLAVSAPLLALQLGVQIDNTDVSVPDE